MQEFQCFVVTNDAERDECFAVLAAVRAQELNRTVDGSVIESHAFGGKAVDYALLACRDVTTGRIVACLRTTPAAALADVATTIEEYRLDLANAELLARSAIVTRLAALPEYRRTGAALELMTATVRHHFGDDVEVLWITCEPGLFPMYKRLGFRPIGRVHQSSTGGYRVPMVLLVHDAEHLARCGSPFLAALPPAGGHARLGLDWYAQIVARNGAIDPGVSLYDPAEPGDPADVLTRGLSDEARHALLEHAIVLRCAQGDRVIAEHDGGRNLLVVRRGMLEVRHGTRTLAMLGAGDLTGELAFILSRKRSADVIAATPDTEILCISLSAFDRLLEPADRATVWRNVATDLSRKLLATNALVA